MPMKPIFALLTAMGIILGFAVYKNRQINNLLVLQTPPNPAEPFSTGLNSMHEVTGSQRDTLVEQFMQQAIANPNNPNPGYEAGVINLFTKELEKSPQDTSIRSNFVAFLMARGLYSKAKEHLAILLSQSTNNSLYLKQMQQVNEHLK